MDISLCLCDEPDGSTSCSENFGKPPSFLFMLKSSLTLYTFNNFPKLYAVSVYMRYG